jgi:hypothetical protein
MADSRSKVNYSAMAAGVLVWSLVLALSVTMLAAAAWFVVVAWQGIRQ